jgi:hypothetical protein
VAESSRSVNEPSVSVLTRFPLNTVLDSFVPSLANSEYLESFISWTCSSYVKNKHVINHGVSETGYISFLGINIYSKAKHLLVVQGFE